MSLQALLDLSLVGRASAHGLDDAATDPASIATLRFGELEARANATARLLDARGFVAGDRLGVLLPNRIELLDLFLACVRLGVIAVPMNALYREREVAHLVRDAAPKVVVTTADRAAHLPPGTAWWDVSPLSTLGALCIATLADPAAQRTLFRQLLTWGLAMIVVGALLCQLAAGWAARL